MRTRGVVFVESSGLHLAVLVILHHRVHAHPLEAFRGDSLVPPTRVLEVDIDSYLRLCEHFLRSW